MEIEKETILLMSKGDKKAYETMFRRFYPKVHRFVAMLLKTKMMQMTSASSSS